VSDRSRRAHRDPRLPGDAGQQRGIFHARIDARLNARTDFTGTAPQATLGYNSGPERCPDSRQRAAWPVSTPCSSLPSTLGRDSAWSCPHVQPHQPIRRGTYQNSASEFLNRDPHRGQPLNWVDSRGMFVQAASNGVDGVCRAGPCDPSPGHGLYRVESRLEGKSLIVYPRKIISGGFSPEPSWITDLKQFLMKRSPNSPSPSQNHKAVDHKSSVPDSLLQAEMGRRAGWGAASRCIPDSGRRRLLHFDQAWSDYRGWAGRFLPRDQWEGFDASQ